MKKIKIFSPEGCWPVWSTRRRRQWGCRWGGWCRGGCCTAPPGCSPGGPPALSGNQQTLLQLQMSYHLHSYVWCHTELEVYGPISFLSTHNLTHHWTRDKRAIFFYLINPSPGRVKFSQWEKINIDSPAREERGKYQCCTSWQNRPLGKKKKINW